MTRETSLFASPTDEPLAARMRPRTLEEYVGQDHILGPGRLLRRAIQADQLSSLIFHGPPGTGKTTLARVIANSTKAHFEALNAVLSGVKNIREAVRDADQRRRMGRRTLLFVDEVHRFNKAQQDALLPWVENGTVVLIGATTENPYFEVNGALVSRSRIFRLEPLGAASLRRIARAALADRERGFGRLDVAIDDDALDHLVDVANGDARAVLNALELAVTTTEADDAGRIRIDRSVAEESIQQRAVLYDKEGDAHFDTISAFIKSVRGSDPDASLYWLAKMVYAGEDPRYILRRLLILASEDIGLADPDALVRVQAAAQAFDRVGMPEGRYHLAQATLVLATAPKSNSTLGFFDALAAVEAEADSDVPDPLKDASRDHDGFGHGVGYLYPHAYRDHWVAQQYLPDALQGNVFYQPSDQGYEAAVRDAVARRREAQLAAMLERDADGPPEIFSTGPTDRATDRWLQRTISGHGATLGELRDAVLDAAALPRHGVVLDLDAGSGLLTWEAVRRTPEGQVWSVVHDPEAAAALREQAAALPELRRPVVVESDPRDAGALGAALDARLAALDPAAEKPLAFDAVVGRGVLLAMADAEDALAPWARLLAARLRPGGRLALLERVPLRSQRIVELVPEGAVPDELRRRARDAEDALYQASTPRFRWTPEGAQAALEQAGLSEVRIAARSERVDRLVPGHRVDAWFPPQPGTPSTAPGAANGPGRAAASSDPSFAARLGERLGADEVERLADAFRRHVAGRTHAWQTTWAVVTGSRGQRQAASSSSPPGAEERS